jgi:16S rRNA processing protein RimM
VKVKDFKKRNTVFIEFDGLLVPFFIESFQEKSSDSAIVKLLDIDTETQAKEYCGRDVYISGEQVSKAGKQNTGMPVLSGYNVIDKNLGFVGIADEIMDIVSNPLLMVKNGERDFLIPLHENIILGVDHKKKELRILAPEGLFDL